jgi:hypothetical protein
LGLEDGPGLHPAARAARRAGAPRAVAGAGADTLPDLCWCGERRATCSRRPRLGAW